MELIGLDDMIRPTRGSRSSNRRDNVPSYLQSHDSRHWSLRNNCMTRTRNENDEDTFGLSAGLF